jgi:hypothetical protein
MKTSQFSLFLLANIVVGHGNHDQSPLLGPHKKLWYNVLPGDGGTQVCEPRIGVMLVLRKDRRILCFLAYQRLVELRTTRVCLART